jgi:WD40 repeat protein
MGRHWRQRRVDRTVRLWDPTTGQRLHTLEGIPTVTSLSFSKNGCYLNTDRGIQILNSSALGTHHNLEQPTHLMFVNKTWVTQSTQNLLWLPPEYRGPSDSAVHDNIFALGYHSGQSHSS